MDARSSAKSDSEERHIDFPALEVICQECCGEGVAWNARCRECEGSGTISTEFGEYIYDFIRKKMEVDEK